MTEDLYKITYPYMKDGQSSTMIQRNKEWPINGRWSVTHQRPNQCPPRKMVSLPRYPCEYYLLFALSQERLPDLVTPNADCMCKAREYSQQRTMYPPNSNLAPSQIKVCDDLLLLIAKCRTTIGSATRASRAPTAPPPSRRTLLRVA